MSPSWQILELSYRIVCSFSPCVLVSFFQKGPSRFSASRDELFQSFRSTSLFLRRLTRSTGAKVPIAVRTISPQRCQYILERWGVDSKSQRSLKKGRSEDAACRRKQTECPGSGRATWTTTTTTSIFQSTRRTIRALE
jgi:hypothetical protein